jgi:putative redox protein
VINAGTSDAPGWVPEGFVVPSLEVALQEPLLPTPNAGEAVIVLNDLAGMDFTARAPSGHELILDTDAGAGGHDGGINPQEMLLVALAGCAGMDVIAILRKKRQLVTGYRVRVAASQQQAYPQVYTAMVVQHIVSGPHLDPRAVARAVELSATKYCPVSAMLAQACPIVHQFRVVISE